MQCHSSTGQSLLDGGGRGLRRKQARKSGGLRGIACWEIELLNEKKDLSQKQTPNESEQERENFQRLIGSVL